MRKLLCPLLALAILFTGAPRPPLHRVGLGERDDRGETGEEEGQQEEGQQEEGQQESRRRE